MSNATLPSETSTLLTKELDRNFYKITNFTRNSLKRPSLPEIKREFTCFKITNNSSNRTIFVMISLQRAGHATLLFSSFALQVSRARFCVSGALQSGTWCTDDQCPQVLRGPIQQCANWVHCKRRVSEKSMFLAIFGSVLIVSERLFSRNSSTDPFNLIKAPIFTNTAYKSTCLCNAPSLRFESHHGYPNRHLRELP